LVEAPHPKINQIPAILLTGFLGSGKTTLLRSLLSCEDAKDTAVIVNEFGEIGLDHHLLMGASETTFVLENGCVCCSVRDDLEAGLEELFWQRLRREIPWFARVVVETTGLADPCGVLQLVSGESLVGKRYDWVSVVTAVDGVCGRAALENHSESVAQALMADSLIVTKTDLADMDMIEALEARLQILNPGAEMYRSSKGEFGASLAALMKSTRSQKGRQDLFAQGQASNQAHSADVTACWLSFNAAQDKADFMAAISDLKDKLGGNFLRAKGLVEFIGGAGPSVVQYVAGGDVVIEDAEHLGIDAKPSGLVVIGSGTSDSEIHQIFTGAGLSPLLQSTPDHHHAHGGG